MIGDNIGLLEMGLVLGLTLVFLVYQYWSTGRSIARDKAARERAANSAPSDSQQ
ncbi:MULTISPECIES: hypothetical protein [unclassified Sphingomonas]|uniref:hypothetical protein n=1 Tax=unclassified Sphingomonas TaxID=196159 RepID=UPI0026D4AEEA